MICVRMAPHTISLSPVAHTQGRSHDSGAAEQTSSRLWYATIRDARVHARGEPIACPSHCVPAHAWLGHQMSPSCD